MDETALKLRCLELAIEQCRINPPTDFKEGVAELQTWLYNRIISSDSVTLSEQPATDKLVKRKRQTIPVDTLE